MTASKPAAAPKPATRLRNKFPGYCERCGIDLEVGEGSLHVATSGPKANKYYLLCWAGCGKGKPTGRTVEQFIRAAHDRVIAAQDAVAAIARRWSSEKANTGRISDELRASWRRVRDDETAAMKAWREIIAAQAICAAIYVFATGRRPGRMW
jgi:hypothetical protein